MEVCTINLYNIKTEMFLNQEKQHNLPIIWSVLRTGPSHRPKCFVRITTVDSVKHIEYFESEPRVGAAPSACPSQRTVYMSLQSL